MYKKGLSFTKVETARHRYVYKQERGPLVDPENTDISPSQLNTIDH